LEAFSAIQKKNEIFKFAEFISQDQSICSGPRYQQEIPTPAVLSTRSGSGYILGPWTGSEFKIKIKKKKKIMFLGAGPFLKKEVK
jgi:hypothetical protein